MNGMKKKRKDDVHKSIVTRHNICCKLIEILYVVSTHCRHALISRKKEVGGK